MCSSNSLYCDGACFRKICALPLKSDRGSIPERSYCSLVTLAMVTGPVCGVCWDNRRSVSLLV